MNLNISTREFLLMRKYIEDKCGIYISEGKEYLIEARLLKLLISLECENFEQFYNLISKSEDHSINEKIIDAITTNETFWFRDKGPWEILEQILMPKYIEDIRNGKYSKVRIWSSACSTGQEPYSIAMCIYNYLYTRGIKDVDINNFEIIATDISNSVLKIAKAGKYDSISIMRGMNDKYKLNYFKQSGRVWTIDDEIKNMVTFKKFNLKDNFGILGKFHLVFCRYVTIYFSNKLKNEVLYRISNTLNEQGILMMGNSEIFLNYSSSFKAVKQDNYQYYKVKR